MRRLEILNISPSANPAVPSTIEVGLDFTPIFHGKEWIDSTGTRFPYYTYDNNVLTAAPAPPTGTVVLVATTFDVVENTKYAGRYTVYTKSTVGDLEPAEYESLSGRTIIRVNEALPTGSGIELTSGYITHISTYLLTVTGEPNLLLLEQENKSDRPVELSGRLSIGWGEIMMQNLLRQAQSFAGPSAPANPFQGQLWFDTVNGLLMIKPTAMNNGDWIVANSNDMGSKYRHVQSTPSSTWTVTHSLNLSAPWIAGCDFFVDVGGAVKPILPIDVTYVDANTLTVTFSNPETGHVIVRG